MHSTGILQKLSEFGMIQVVRQFLHKERSMDMAQTTKNAIRKGFLDLLEQRPLDKISVVDYWYSDWSVTWCGCFLWHCSLLPEYDVFNKF